MFAAKPEDIRSAGKLLFHGSPVLLGESRILNSDAAGGRYRKAQDSFVHSHFRSFFGFVDFCASQPKLQNKWGLGRFAQYNKM